MRRTGPVFLSLLSSIILLFYSGCTGKQERIVHPSFYYWKSLFKLQAAESKTLLEQGIETLYIKFFDVVWDPVNSKPAPVAIIDFREKPPGQIAVTPVLFITNEALQRSTPEQTDSLAANILKLLSGIVSQQPLSLSNELQIDCDWTMATRENYFRLLHSIRQNGYGKNKIISATIRLHQLKFTNETGIPPVDKGLLMCYNMGNLQNPGTVNSILDPGELKKYIGLLPLYPLSMDIALPVFNWWVWFRGDHYKGLIHADRSVFGLQASNRIIFNTDTMINGYSFQKGDGLRYEDSPAASIREVNRLLRHKLATRDIHVILYHLDEHNLSNYSAHELESFFDGLR